MGKISYKPGIPKYSQADLMSEQEIHDFGIEIVFGFLKAEGYAILDVQTEKGIHPSIIANKKGKLYIIEVSTEIAPKMGELPGLLKSQLIEHGAKMNAIPCFASVGIGSCDGKRFEASIALKGDGFYANFTGLEYL
ncbi:MAG: hypothetical protein EOM59_09310 [Clostridia bacterium]|nr:hypothetical protein [Clostridia bacterium]